MQSGGASIFPHVSAILVYLRLHPVKTVAALRRNVRAECMPGHYPDASTGLYMASTHAGHGHTVDDSDLACRPFGIIRRIVRSGHQA